MFTPIFMTIRSITFKKKKKKKKKKNIASYCIINYLKYNIIKYFEKLCIYTYIHFQYLNEIFILYSFCIFYSDMFFLTCTKYLTTLICSFCHAIYN